MTRSLLLLLAGVSVLPARAAEPARVEVVMMAEARGKVVRNSEASMVELKDGRLLAVWQAFEKGAGDSDFFPGQLVTATSRDGGRTWGKPRVLVANEPGDINVYSPSLLRLPDDSILFCFMRYHSFTRAQNKYPPASVFAWQSKDEGKTFQPLATLWREKPITVCSATLRRLSSGRILLPINRDLSKKGQPDHWDAGVIFSDDKGKSWQQCDNWVDLPKRGAMEPHVEELSDGRLLMVMRTQLGAVYRAHSPDAGKTWTRGESLGIEAPESCPELIRIPSTKDLLLIWNGSKFDPKWASHFGKRTPLSAAVSKDDGKTWSKPRHVETDPGWAFSNPGCCFTRKGTVVVNYWACKYQPSGLMSNYPIHLKAAIIDIPWLYETPRLPTQKTKAEDVRGAVEKALPLLVKGSEGHVEKRTCFACHNQGVPMLAFAAAREHGFDVSAEGVKKQAEFIAAFLGRNRENYKQGKGQGGQVDTAGYALLALERGGWKADATTEAVVEYLLQRDRDTDHWKTRSNRPPSEVSDFTATYLALRALRHWGPAAQKERIAQRIEAARGWLLRTKPRDTEERVFRLWGLREAGAADSALRLAVKSLVESQRKDGGWAQTDTMDSDAYATGSALVVLHQAGQMPTKDPVYQRGIAFLMSSQLADGSWKVRSRSRPFQTYYESGFPHGKDQFISMAASGWATTALALACPPVR